MIFKTNKPIYIVPSLSNSTPSHTFGVHEKFISYNKNNIYIQTPIGVISQICTNSVIISFSNLDKKNNIFKKNIIQLFHNCNDVLIKQSSKNIILTSPIIETCDDKFSMVFQCKNNFCVFDCNNHTPSSYDSTSIFKLHEHYDFIIHISKLKISCPFFQEKNIQNIRASIISSVCQVRKHSHYEHLVTNLFIPCDFKNKINPPINNYTLCDQIQSIPDKNSFIEHPTLGVYFKMIKRKVPIQAVRQKMCIDKIDQDILLFNPNDIIPDKILKLYLNLSNTMSNEMEAKKSSLKQTEINNKKYKGFNLGISLEDITTRLFGLKKTNNDILLK
jgi:hypothetical protein